MSTPGPATASGADRHAADVEYAQMMLPHVTQGVELTAMVPTRAADPGLARLVQLMDNADVEEQGQLVGRLHAWGAPVPGENGVPMTLMAGMADGATLTRLRGLSGPAFDQAWLAVMVTHHQGGVDMSREYLDQGVGQSLTGVAQTQVEIGERQIGQMRALQGRA